MYENRDASTDGGSRSAFADVANRGIQQPIRFAWPSSKVSRLVTIKFGDDCCMHACMHACLQPKCLWHHT